MNFDHAKNKIGYPCIFSQSTEEAISSLLRLILNKECGFNEGATQWSKELSRWLDRKFDLSELNHCGASFSAEQWRDILTKVIDGLKRKEE